MTISTAAVAGRISVRRRSLRLVAITACLPYLSLKLAWVAGSHLGIPDGSPLLEHRLTMALANGLTVLMDAAVVVLTLLLTRPWGRRVPAWLLAVPMWLAVGLLSPIMVGFPLQLVLHGGEGGRGGTGDKPFLDDWVFGVVYGGFIVQGLALGALFTGYARERWGRLWRGRMRELPARGGAAQRLTATTAALVALFPGTVRLLRGCGAIGPAGGGDRSMEFVYVLFLAAAVTGAWQLAFRRGRTLPVAVPLALAWTGSAAVACWGGWMSLATLVTGDRPTALTGLTYAGQMITGFLVATVTARFLADRSGKAPQ
ncbi:hypothetical protein BFF78_31905 [Streptomyces fodineus]|uniref:Aromatic ring-opening dioxygenase LigA n=1 Tax=Streptomyces fodineus TaxID=1904616 RepID=A0A1D7YHG0_9ACTN|nr:hypothetical protein [Streptomyces fodineus]AOR35048.1 hypothetical protein BFF78_31905 [Streptomyces fodineus]